MKKILKLIDVFPHHGTKGLSLYWKKAYSNPGKYLPTIRSSRSNQKNNKIIRYLKKGYLCFCTLGTGIDPFKPMGNNDVAYNYIFTDSVWAWFDILPYFLKNYRIKLPKEFLAHLEKKNFIIDNEEQIKNMIKKDPECEHMKFIGYIDKWGKDCS